MSAHQTQSDLETKRELRQRERQRFIKQQRLKPSFWFASTSASLKYGFYLLVVALVILPPAIFYWCAVIASFYEISAIQDILTHVALGIEQNVSGANEIQPGLDAIGIAIWALIGIISAVIGWFSIPFQSPLQKAADKHMMEWSPALPIVTSESDDTLSIKSGAREM